jgi:hypothetical protein
MIINAIECETNTQVQPGVEVGRAKTAQNEHHTGLPGVKRGRKRDETKTKTTRCNPE